MSIWTLLQIVVNLVMFVGMMALWLRLRRPPQDDPRLSRGLQLLQTKITVLEDLSDRTDAQVKTLTGLLDQKNRMLQNKILEAEQQVLKIDHSMEKSMEVAEIFQDKIPHHEILERQRTVEYVKAARMAHSGVDVEEIIAAVALPREQVELIAKFNREQLMFDETALPDWAVKATSGDTPTFALGEMNFVSGIERPATDFDNMAKIESEFKAAVKTARDIENTPIPTLLDNKVADTLKAGVASGLQSMGRGMDSVERGMHSGMQTMQPAVMSMKATAQTLRDKLVATAEDILKAQGGPAARVSVSSREPMSLDGGSNGHGGGPAGASVYGTVSHASPAHNPAPIYSRTATHIVRAPDALGTREASPEIKKVIFPKIDR